MRRVYRPVLPRRVQTYLDSRRRATAGASSVERAWKAARQTKTMTEVVRNLHAMAGERERCMYCMDSHGSDIEHFWPKGFYPERTFLWPNMLLCCTECGRFKGNRFPLLDAGFPALVDPSAEDPWEFLEFDPDTGNLTARYDVAGRIFSPKGVATVETLQLDRREGMAAGYRKTYRRIVDYVRNALAQGIAEPRMLADELMQLDDHGLLGWCFGPVGIRIEPFKELKRRAPEAWHVCASAAQ